MNLKDKVVWVTGSSRGIGKAIAQKFADAGSKVVISSRNMTEVQNVEEPLFKQGKQALGLVCDISQKKHIDKLVAKVNDEWGAIDILVNNAGIGIFKKIADLSENEWERMHNTNAKGVFLATQAVLPGMIEKQSGHIINVISVAGRQPYYNCGGYCASKYALMGFSDVLRMETRKHGIKVTAFLPGATDTDIWGTADVDRDKMMKPEHVADSLISIFNLDQNVTPEEFVVRPNGGDL